GVLAPRAAAFSAARRAAGDRRAQRRGDAHGGADDVQRGERPARPVHRAPERRGGDLLRALGLPALPPLGRRPDRGDAPAAPGPVRPRAAAADPARLLAGADRPDDLARARRPLLRRLVDLLRPPAEPQHLHAHRGARPRVDAQRRALLLRRAAPLRPGLRPLARAPARPGAAAGGARGARRPRGGVRGGPHARAPRPSRRRLLLRPARHVPLVRPRDDPRGAQRPPRPPGAGGPAGAPAGGQRAPVGAVARGRARARRPHPPRPAARVPVHLHGVRLVHRALGVRPAGGAHGPARGLPRGRPRLAAHAAGLAAARVAGARLLRDLPLARPARRGDHRDGDRREGPRGRVRRRHRAHGGGGRGLRGRLVVPARAPAPAAQGPAGPAPRRPARGQGAGAGAGAGRP
ncbi:MAG: hypothetical protein AVDCRST_MAG13-2433, partial [uncultured Solirubrobacteraceae bacterium]